MNQNTISGDVIGVTLRQLGATSIREIHSMMHIASFTLEDGVEVVYVFNITKGNQYYLQRMRPYPLPWGVFADTAQITRFIKEDIAKFRNAAHSSNFNRFITMAENVNMLVGQLEELFLNSNVDSNEFHDFDQQLDHLLALATQLRSHADPL